jgi:ankyrin repeat protein
MNAAGVLDAIQRGDLAGLQELLADDPAGAAARSASGVSAVALACYGQRMDLVQALLAAKPPLDAFEAAMLGLVDRLRERVAADPGSVRSASADGFTALHLAAFFGHTPAVALLLERDADARAVSRNPMRLAPIHSATAGRHRDVAALLLEHGADPNACQAGGFTPLHAAARQGDAELVELLLEHGADPSLSSDDGRNAVAFAAESGHAALAERLQNALPGAIRPRPGPGSPRRS